MNLQFYCFKVIERTQQLCERLGTVQQQSFRTIDEQMLCPYAKNKHVAIVNVLLPFLQPACYINGHKTKNETI